MSSLQRGSYEAAELYLRQALRLDGKNAEALRLTAVVLAMQGRQEDALSFICKAASIATRNPVIHSNMGNILLSLGRHEEALKSYEKAIALAPSDAEIRSNQGNALQELGRHEEALKSYEKAIALAPNLPEAFNNYGNALQKLGRREEALKSYEKAIALAPNYALAWNGLGTIYRELQKYHEAMIAYEKAIENNPECIQALLNRGLISAQLKNYKEASTYYDRALQIQPNYLESWLNKGVAFKDQGLHLEAITCYDRVIEINSEYAMAWYNKGLSLEEMDRHQDAISCYERALEINPDYPFLMGKRAHLLMISASWAEYEHLLSALNQGVRDGKKVAEPFGYQGLADSEENLFHSAKLYAREFYPTGNKNFNYPAPSEKKIRLGYLCGEFRSQATSILMVELFELCNKSQFEIYAFDNGWDDGSDIRKRLDLAFNKIIDISRMSDHDAAQCINQMNIDILVNLNGYFGRARQGIFALKPAPIQVNYLGFPGTLGADYIDYIIADKTVIPETSAKYYSEKIAYLPNSYQVNDSKRVISDVKFSRADFGLPDDTFIFCCFNNTYKITPATFDIWMRILLRVPNSILWLLGGNELSRTNLHIEAEKRGVSRSRIIFCERLGLPEHLARHKLADLFLDTLPYNAHTTTSDALWAGLPVLTQIGKTFPGRVSASLLKALALSELITESEKEFEDLAVSLAVDTQRLITIRNKLNAARLVEPLFNTTSFTQNIQKAYTQMMDLHKSNLRPTQITVG